MILVVAMPVIMITCQGAFVCKSRAAHRTPTTCNMQRATWYKGTAFEVDRVEIVLISAYFIG